MATLKDISAELGLSVTTVSRALNGFPEVNARTRTRVQKAAERLGYRPNTIAKRLVTGRSGMVGMIARLNADLVADRTFLEILTGLTAALGARDVDLVLNADQHDDPVFALQRMYERGILDGFILNAPVRNDPRVAYLKRHKIPFVLHGKDRDEADYPYYAIDNRAVSADSVALLSALGHKRIALINGERLHAYAQDRLAGFVDAMEAANLPLDERVVSHGVVSFNYGYTRTLALLSGRAGQRPTALLCASLPIAAGACRALRDLGLSVPAEVSIMAHDDGMPVDGPDLSFTRPLTVTRSPLRDACLPLANHLLAAIEGAPVETLQTCVKAQLVLGETTALSPKGGDVPWL